MNLTDTAQLLGNFGEFRDVYDPKQIRTENRFEERPRQVRWRCLVGVRPLDAWTRTQASAQPGSSCSCGVV